jgi:hypothetical protein
LRWWSVQQTACAVASFVNALSDVPLRIVL